MKKFALLLTGLWLTVSVGAAPAAIIEFDLLGNAGAGLLGGNENTNPAPSNPGSGGEIGAGITFDDVTNMLSINVGWGSGNGFTDLTGPAQAMHIHDANSSAFTANGGVIVNLGSQAGFNADATIGGFNGVVALTAPQATDLLAGELYLNTHTAVNGGGEIRGNLVVSAVPEPTSMTALAAIGGVVAWRRRRRR